MANKDEYERAANAVQNGTASQRQKELNAQMAKQAGRMGNDARAAERGEKKW